VKRVVILDHGRSAGDPDALRKAVAVHGVEATVDADFGAAVEADGLLVTGAGTYADCMASLRGARGERIIGRRLAGARPVFALGVGMQLLFERGRDGDGTETEGCGEWPGAVEPLDAAQVAWAALDLPDGSAMFAGVDRDALFAFDHAHAAHAWHLNDTGPLPPPKVAWCRIGERPFVAAVENGALWAVQFHPERSGDAGAAVLANWVSAL
jgi:glutamine amidotransferase